jgi:NAD(P)-dependent dehydrogenase (short-subunit alcohol dehydrogenase family)
VDLGGAARASPSRVGVAEAAVGPAPARRRDFPAESCSRCNALVFLASDEARFITGVALPVDAGAAIK